MLKLTRCWPPVGWVSYISRPTWGEVGEGNFGYLLALRGQERRPFAGPSCMDRYGRYHVKTWNWPSLSHGLRLGYGGNSWLEFFLVSPGPARPGAAATWTVVRGPLRAVPRDDQGRTQQVELPRRQV